MTLRRSKWLAVPALAAIAATAALLSAAATQRATPAERGEWGVSGGSSPQGNAPEQPIAFPHPAHVQRLGMNCLYCHFSAAQSPDPGMPSVSTCMGCHGVVIGPDRRDPATGQMRRSEGIAKLQEYGKAGKPIPWVRIHKVPDYVNFPHMRHVNAGVACQSCHGDVQKMERVFQYASLNMGWCIRCHVDGYTPPARPPDGLAAFASAGDSAAAMRGGQQTQQTRGVLVGSSDYPRRARYDCSTCHF